MNHPTSDERLDLALDTLEGDRLREVAAHVARCGSCGKAYRELREEQEALRRSFGHAEPGAKKLEAVIIEKLFGASAPGTWFPAAALISTAGVVFLGVLALIVFMPRSDPQLVLDQLELIEREAVAHDEAGRLDEAVDRYVRALELIEGNDYFKSKAMFYRQRIKEIKADREALAEANKAFAELQADFKKARGSDMHHEVLKKAKTLKTTYGQSDIITWKNELKILIERVEKVLDTEAATNKRLDFQVRRNEIMASCKLSGDPNKALWGQAVVAWNEYLGEEVAANSKTKATNEIRVINNRARDSFRSVKNRASRMIDSNQKADAIEMLKKESDRFKGTESEKELEALLQSMDL